LYKLMFTKQAAKDAKKLTQSNLRKNAEKILEILQNNPFAEYPPYEKLLGDLSGRSPDGYIFSTG